MSNMLTARRLRDVDVALLRVETALHDAVTATPVTERPDAARAAANLLASVSEAVRPAR